MRVGSYRFRSRRRQYGQPIREQFVDIAVTPSLRNHANPFDRSAALILTRLDQPSETSGGVILQGIAESREEQRAYHETVVQEIRTEIKEQELLMDRLYDDRLHRLIAEDFFRQR